MWVQDWVPARLRSSSTAPPLGCSGVWQFRLFCLCHNEDEGYQTLLGFLKIQKEGGSQNLSPSNLFTPAEEKGTGKGEDEGEEEKGEDEGDQGIRSGRGGTRELQSQA